jgi:dynein intermediate chain 2
MFEREMRRQKLLEAKMREIKLKEKELERERIRKEMRLEYKDSFEDTESDLVVEAQNNFFTKVNGRKNLKTTLKSARIREVGANVLKVEAKKHKAPGKE